jgi:23S rRNA (guanosine2251-2'-O)-methyltransferase
MNRLPQKGKPQAKKGAAGGRQHRRGATVGKLPGRTRPAHSPSRSEVLYGIHPVQEMLRAGRRRCTAIWIARHQEQLRMAELRDLAAASGIPIQTISVDRLEKNCHSSRHQGVAAEVSPFPLTELGAVLTPASATASPQPPPILALDSISDPQNLGAILRTAQCAGCEAVLLPKDRSVRPTAAVSKASAGALEHTRLIQVTNLANTLERFKKSGFWVAGTDAATGNPLFSIDLTGPLVLVIGGEAKGMRPLVRQRCDFLVTIPQVGPIGSLNASAAAAVVLYEAFRQRGYPGAGSRASP